jgi:geranylgeranyl pyrophosphate synthase
MREHVDRVHQIVGERLAQHAPAPFRAPLEAAFRDRLASGDKGTPWFMLPILTCEALGGDVEPAHHVAAGLEIGRIAAGCLDEWQDHDTEDALWQAIGPERTVGMATGMIALSLLAVNHLAELGINPGLVLALQREFEMALLRMSAGQYADLGDDLSLDDYEGVAGAKTGALFQLGCWAGATVAGAPVETAELYGDFGYHLGLLAQVWNDLFGLAGFEGKNDAEQQRALPILAALAVDGDLEQTGHGPQSVGRQAGELYTVLHLGTLYGRAAEALAECPSLGSLPRCLDEYHPARLVEMIQPSQAQHEEEHGHQAA